MRPELESLAASAGAPSTGPRFGYLDYSDVFDRCGAEEEVFLDSYHFGDRGNEIIAARLCDDLMPHLTSLRQGQTASRSGQV
jgi:hypothetical protein